MSKPTGYKTHAGAVGGVFFIGFLVNFMSSLFVMLALGVMHDYFPVIPPLGYWETYLVMIGINFVGNAVKTGIKTKMQAEDK